MDDLIKKVLCHYKGDVIASAIAIGDIDLNEYYAHLEERPRFSGAYGSVDMVIHMGTTYARKMIQFREDDFPAYDRSDFEKEVRLQEEAFEIGLAPEIHRAWSQNNLGTIIMDALLPPEWISVPKYVDTKGDINEVNEVFTSIIQDVVRLYQETQIEHGDLHLNNIFYNTETQQFKFIDFGRATKGASTKGAVVARALRSFWKDWTGENYYRWIQYPLEKPELEAIHPDDRDDVTFAYEAVQEIFKNLDL